MATVARSAPINPTKSGRYPIVIGESLLEETPRKRQRICVQYNHKPKALDTQPALIRASKNGKENTHTLSFKSETGTGKYRYQGGQRPSTSLALVYDPEKQSFVLQKINADFYFNLQATPTNEDADALAAKYPQLGVPDPTKDANVVDGGEDEEDPDDIPADPDNPYDYRHFLRRGASPSPQPSLQSSPIPNHTFNSSPMLKASSPIPRPRSRTAPEKQSQQARRYLSPNPRGRANTADEPSDSNALVIDMGESEPRQAKPWRAALGALNDERGRSRKPISLRSAASSMSPSVRARSPEEDDNKGDDDVEEIDLGESRLTSHDAEKVDIPVDGNGWDDEDGNILEAELEQAMEQEAENGQVDQQPHISVGPPAESSSESEEE